jgi:hypothetical protein
LSKEHAKAERYSMRTDMKMRMAFAMASKSCERQFPRKRQLLMGHLGATYCLVLDGGRQGLIAPW